MAQLTPLEESVAVRELIQIGMEKGILIGQIQMAQRSQNLPVSPKEKLGLLSIEELEKKLAQLDPGSV